MDNSQLTMAYINEIAKKLKDPKKNGAVSLMVGAGFSKNAVSKNGSFQEPPDWRQLSESMYEEMYPKPFDLEEKRIWDEEKIRKTYGKNVTKLAEEYMVCFGREKLNQLIEVKINDEEYEPGTLYKQLLELNWADVFTTNYDTLLERANVISNYAEKYKVVYSQEDLQESNRPRIIKLHGTVHRKRPYIISEEDYRTYPVKYAAMVNTVQQAMLETKLCLIGFSGDDPNFQSWLGWLRDNLGEVCPKCYLIGLFNNLKEPEIKLLEQKQISIVDLSCFVNDKDMDYKKALEVFLEYMKTYSGENDNENLLELIYKNVWIGSREELVKKIEYYINKHWNNYQQYIIYPPCNHLTYFQKLMKAFIDVEEFHEFNILGKLMTIYRNYQIVLWGETVEKIKSIVCNHITMEEHSEDNWFPIIIYLLEFYRISDQTENYNCILNFIEQLQIQDQQHKNDFLIEKVKYHMYQFNYKEARSALSDVKKPNIFTSIQMASLYLKLDGQELAKSILDRAANRIVQSNFSETMYTSYMSYLELVYQNLGGNITEKYLGERYNTNQFNIKKILSELYQKLNGLFVLDNIECTENTQFVLNYTTKTSKWGVNELLEACLEYIAILDRLSLVELKEECVLLPQIIKKLASDKFNVNWCLFTVAGLAHTATINRVFSREILSNIALQKIEILFNRLMMLLDTFAEVEDSIKKRHILTQESIVDILARLIAYLEDEKVIELIRKLYSIKSNLNIIRIIEPVFQLLSTRINGNICEHIFDDIIMESDQSFGIIDYVVHLKIKINNPDRHYKKLLDAEQPKIDRYYILKLYILWRNHPLEKYKERVKNIIWGEGGEVINVNEIKIWIWKYLPHPKEFNFEKLCYEYVANIDLEDEYEDKINYEKILRLTILLGSEKRDDTNLLDNTTASKICMLIHAAYTMKYLDKEDFDRMNKNNEIYDEDYILLLIFCKLYSNNFRKKYNSNTCKEIENFKSVLTEVDMTKKCINIIDSLEKKDYKQAFIEFDDIILIGNKDMYECAFYAVACALNQFVYETSDTCELTSMLVEFIKKVRFINISYSKNIWSQMTLWIRCKELYTEEVKAVLHDEIMKCIVDYTNNLKTGNRYYVDALYNIAIFINKYTSRLEYGKEKVMDDCIEKLENTSNYEIMSALKTSEWEILDIDKG